MHGSRRRAEAADIVVTNHSLLFCDLVADGGLLPPIRYWVVDEAHGAEAEARRAFSLSLSAEDITRLANRVGADEASRNVFVRAERRVVVPGMEAVSYTHLDVYKRQSLTHSYGVRDTLPHVFLDDKYLVDYFSRCEIARKTFLACRAERACDGTPCLRGEAYGQAIVVARRDAYGPVSYTHIDVYKRQHRKVRVFVFSVSRETLEVPFNRDFR